MVDFQDFDLSLASAADTLILSFNVSVVKCKESVL